MTSFACGVLLMLPLGGFAQAAVRGDVNDSGGVDVDDINVLINIMLNTNQDLSFETRADVNGDGSVDIDDLNVVINVTLGKDGGGLQDDGDWVDLGLPSGTLWATRNIGASSPEDYGDYFAWGETTPKAVYDLDTYKWYKNGYYDANGHWHIGGWTKYCTFSSDGFDHFVDGKTELDLADDVAAANWGGGARMPSLDQFQELINNCQWQWTQRNGVYGQLATGPNGNAVFFPAAGYRWDSTLDNVGCYGYYWSRTLDADDSLVANHLHFGWRDVVCFSMGIEVDRLYGHTVRAVRIQ